MTLSIEKAEGLTPLGFMKSSFTELNLCCHKILSHLLLLSSTSMMLRWLMSVIE